MTAVLSGFGVMTVLNLVSTHGGLAVMAVSLLLFCGVFLIKSCTPPSAPGPSGTATAG
ncbi:hypothetical protein ACFQV4_19610 [Streptomyces thermocarboxydus]